MKALRSSAGAGAIGWLLLAGTLTALGHGRWNLTIGVWLGTLFFVRFFRCCRTWLALPLFVLVSTASWELAYWGTVPMPVGPRLALFSGLSLVLGVTLLVDRRLAGSSDSFLATLAMPCGWVTYDLANAIFAPTGSWGSIAYAASESLVLAQIASITGWTGLTFLVAWFATAGNWIWDRGLTTQQGQRGLTILAGVFAMVIIGGKARMVWTPNARDTVRVALIAGPSTYAGEHQREVWEYLHRVEVDQEVREKAKGQIRKTQDQYFDMTQRELEAGARMVSWSECDVNIAEADQSDWIDRFATLAATRSTYIGMGLFVTRPQSHQRPVNKFVLIGPDGQVVWDYVKATRVPGRSHIVGDGLLPKAETEFGVLSAGICFDLDFPRLMAQAGRMNADIVLQPADTWPEVKWLHARMGRLRAIEQGFTLLRCAREGIALVTDPLGRTLVMRDTDVGGNGVVVAEAPAKAGIRTVYSQTGDLFAWLCVAGFGVALAALVAGKRRRDQASAKVQTEDAVLVGR